MKRVLEDSTIVNGAIPDVVMQAAATAAREQKFDKLKVVLQTGTTKMKDGSVLNLEEPGVTKRVAIEDIAEPLSNLRIGFSLCYCSLRNSAVMAFYPRTHAEADGKGLLIRHMPPAIFALSHVACEEMAKYGHTTKGQCGLLESL
jgi:hypothetical protein